MISAMDLAAFEHLAESARGRLLQAGFTVAEERSSQAFGNRLIRFDRGQMVVWVTRDRGQAFLALSSHRLDGRWDIGLWEACADRTLPSLEPREFLSDLEWLLLRLPDLESLVELGGPNLETCLRTNGAWRFNARRELGMIKPPGE
jgi:hypothetical protein